MAVLLNNRSCAGLSLAVNNYQVICIIISGKDLDAVIYSFIIVVSWD
jgi:hypothetical protein